MTISISNGAVPLGAPAGTIVGALTAFDATGKPTAVHFQTDVDSLFSIDAHGNLTVRIAPQTAALFAVTVYAVANGEVVDTADFDISVTTTATTLKVAQSP